MTKIMNNAPQPVAESVAPEKEEEQSPRDITDAIKKIKDSVSGLPNLWVNKSATLKSVISDLFECETIRNRFKKIGFDAFFETLISYDAAEYIYAVDSAISLLAPNSFIHKVTTVARNVALLDSMVDLIADKVSVTDAFNDTTEVNKIMKECKDCHIRPRDFDCDSVENVDLSSFFLSAFVGVHIGDTVELVSPKFRSYGDKNIDTVHCTLVYSTVTLEMDEYGLLYRDALKTSAILIIKVKEFNAYILLSPRGGADRHDITIRRLYTAGLTFYILHHNNEDDGEIGWVRALPFATIDMSKKYLCVYNGGSIYANDRAEFSNQSKSGIFDDKTEKLVERIATSGKNRCSRAYALVGIPGTGKSFIMNKLASEDTSSAIIVPFIGEDGLNYDMQRTINVILRSLPQEHVFILLDDFDKCVGSNSDKGTINQMLIEFFTNLHRNCPGGDSKHTFTLIATMNNPKLLNNAIIKRSERFDEVIEIGLPQPEVYGKRLDSLKKEGDLTNFTSFKFRPIYRYMRHKVITLADLGNIYDILRIHRKKDGDAIRYTVMDLIYAVRFIGKNRSSASKEYEI